MKECFRSTQLPAPKGPYSQAVKAGNYLFISGMLGINPETGQTAPDIAGQTSQILENLNVLVSEAGGTLADIVKTTVFLTDMADFATMNEIYATYFPDNPPARSSIQATPPGGYLVEIEAIALLS